jgi:hypothetical protein
MGLLVGHTVSMDQTTIVFLAPLAPLAFGLACAWIASASASAVSTPATTPADKAINHANFERSFDAWVEYEASEEAYNARNGE